MQQNSFSYPAMLDLKNKKCVIIGGGKVAVRKALPLIEAGADLTVIAPAADPDCCSWNCALMQTTISLMLL